MLIGYATEKIEYSISRYENETRRLYRTMEIRLAKSPSGFLVGDRVTIADIACRGWISSHGKAFSLPLILFRPLGSATHDITLYLASDGVSLDEFPNLQKWLDKLSKRPGFEKYCHVLEHVNVEEKLSV